MLTIDIDATYWDRTTGERVIVTDFFTTWDGAYPGMQLVSFIIADDNGPGTVYDSLSLNRFRENYYR